MGAYGKFGYACEDCGVRVLKRYRWDRANLCTNCGLQHAVDAVIAMQEGGGPVYDRWAASKGPAGRPRGTTRQGS